MKFIYCVLALCVWRYSSVHSQGTIIEEWFMQKVDHFDKNSDALWKQRYQINSEFYKAGGPVFLLVVGQYPLSSYSLQSGDMADYAREYNALCVQLEHRYYGASHPVENMSDENLTFLSIDQALADFRDFIRYINHKYDFSSSNSSSTKWVAFGSFYGGTLAAWLRKKYPRLIHMAVVTNPLVAKIDYHEYYDEIQKQIASYNPKCVTQINMAFKETTNQYLTESKIIKQFMLCNNYFDKPDDYEYNSVYLFMSLRMLYEKLYNNFAMFGTDDQSLVFEKINLYNSIIRPYDGFPTPVIENFCNIMLDNSIPSVLDRLAAVFRTTMNFYNLPCIPTYKESIIKPLLNIHFNSVDKNAQLLGWSRPWQYQLCTEFGLFPTIHERTHFVHVGLRFYFFICADLFNIPSNDIQYILGNSTKGINKIYNELNINHDRTIYVHGSIDPWHLLEPNENRKKNTLSVYMKGANYMVNEDDTVPNMDLQDTIFAHLSIKAYISKWLAEE